MADENTQVAPVAGAETNATQDQNSVAEQEQALKAKFPTLTGFVYLSDPDNADPVWHHKVIPVFGDEANVGLPWQVHAERQADNLKDPVWTVGATDWSENDKNNQRIILQQATQKLAELDKKSVELDQANDKVDQALKDMQEVQAQSSRQNLALMKSFTEQTQNTNQILGAMQKTLAMVTKAVGANANNATPANPTTDTKPADQATDKQ
ncbi:hypothetical protein PUW61_08550 [Lactobacillus crispatus]|uniref:hypothetical protein n=1 Tax=Lactobacillus crispatus TaxID=47770 RepID=UPI0023A91DDA|nr:hypothetical protein [Lactobacillus crispatus]WEB23710.1 hypothetical protein PUW61_08550 [Lactobacillus crispatus]